MSDSDSSNSSKRSSAVSAPQSAIPERTTLLSEFSVREVKQEVKKQGLKGHQVVVRAISGFVFMKDGRMWKPTPACSDLQGVTLTGFVASLSSKEDRPIVQSGYWDLKGHLISRFKMELSPTRIYVGTSQFFRHPEQSMWADTQDYSYALTFPAECFEKIWQASLHLVWQGKNSPGPRFVDLAGSDPRPRWWPASDNARFLKVRKLILQAERAAQQDDDSDSATKSMGPEGDGMEIDNAEETGEDTSEDEELASSHGTSEGGEDDDFQPRNVPKSGSRAKKLSPAVKSTQGGKASSVAGPSTSRMQLEANSRSHPVNKARAGEASPSRASASKAGTSKAGSSKAGASTVGASKAGASTASASKASASKAGGIKAGASTAGASQAGASQAGASKAGASKAGASTAGASKAGASTASASKASASKASGIKAGASTAGASQAGASQAGASTAGASTAGASKASASKAGASTASVSKAKTITMGPSKTSDGGVKAGVSIASQTDNIEASTGTASSATKPHPDASGLGSNEVQNPTLPGGKQFSEPPRQGNEPQGSKCAGATNWQESSAGRPVLECPGHESQASEALPNVSNKIMVGLQSMGSSQIPDTALPPPNENPLPITTETVASSGTTDPTPAPAPAAQSPVPVSPPISLPASRLSPSHAPMLVSTPDTILQGPVLATSAVAQPSVPALPLITLPALSAPPVSTIPGPSAPITASSTRRPADDTYLGTTESVASASTNVRLGSAPELVSRQAGQKRALESPEANERAGFPPVETTGNHNPSSELDAAEYGELMPAISYETVEETSVNHDQDLSTEFQMIESFVPVYSGRVVFLVSSMGKKFAHELYLEEAPWSMWNDPIAIGSVRQALGPNLSQSVLSRLPMPKLLLMYATAVCIPLSHRGPVQQRLVARFALYVQNGMFPAEHIRTWVAIQRKVHAWLKEIENLPPNVSAPLPDFSSCFL